MIRLIYHDVTKAAEMWGERGIRKKNRRRFWFYGFQLWPFNKRAFGILVMKKEKP